MIGPFWINDIPTEPVVIELFRDDEAAELGTFTAATATLLSQTGTSTTLTATIIGDSVQVAWPATTPFLTDGIYSITVTLTSSTKRETVAPVPFVVQINDGWHTLTSARAEWRDAPQDDVDLQTLLTVAQSAVEAYAPAITAPGLVPISYRKGQLMQARDTWNVSKIDPASGDIGGDGFAYSPYPLSKEVKLILRPKRAVPVVG